MPNAVSKLGAIPHRYSRIGAALLAMAAPFAAWAICTCGFGDGQFTLVSINVDGNLNDWAPVHADVDNNTCDGPANGISDRDAPVQSTGRDLSHFAFTWDANYIYLFTERSGSVSNTQSFVYYADTDYDLLMETGEPVIGVTWQGSNRRVNVYTFTYVSAAPGGDPMVDGGGFGDGHTLPGSFAGVPSTGNPNRSGAWGSNDGLQMEFFVTWVELGVSPGAAFTFHVASSNASLGSNGFAAQIDDNLSGCGGGLGSTAVEGVQFTPDRNLVGYTSQTVVGVHTLVNTGNAPDSFELSSISGGDFAPVSIRYYVDVDTDGTVSAGDILLTDTDGDGNPDTSRLTAGESTQLLTAYDMPAGLIGGESTTVTTTAASDFQPLVADFVVDTIDIALPPDIVVTKTVAMLEDPINLGNDPKAIPGAEIGYTINVRNDGGGAVDSDTVVITDAIPAGLCFIVLDVGNPGSGPVEFQDGSPGSGLGYSFGGLGDAGDDLEFSDDGGLTFDYEPSDPGSGCDTDITDVRIQPSGAFAGDTGGGAPNFELGFRALIE